MAETKAKKSHHHHLQRQSTSRAKHKHMSYAQPAPPPSWAFVRRFGCSGSLCSLRDTSRVMHGPEAASPETHRKWVPVSGCNDSKRSVKVPLNESKSDRGVSPAGGGAAVTGAAAAGGGGLVKGRNLRRFSGCYECRMVVDPIHGAAKSHALRNSIFPCPHCGQIFAKSDGLEHHQTLRHAVSELGPEDTSRNIIEIIFQSSWLKKQVPVCKIDRILKVHNSQKTIVKFEDYRNSIKAKANRLLKKHPRCVADGNELLRFHCTSFVCSIGVNGSTNLCNSIPNCNVCNIIKNGFKLEGIEGICTTATSGKAHDNAWIASEEEKRAMLVCRVIAGKVKKGLDSAEEFDSVASTGGIYSNLDELYVFNPRAILNCFVVIYSAF